MRTLGAHDRFGLRLALVALLAGGGCSSDSAIDSAANGDRRPEVPEPSPSPAQLSDLVPPEVTAFENDWPLPGRDYRNSRATTHSGIDASTVASLEVAWEVALPGSGAFGNLSTTPLIFGDTVYIQDLSSNVTAISRESGKTLWKHDLDTFVIGPNGVAVGWGLLYAVEGTDDLFALDLDDGTEVWRERLTRTPTDGVDIQPTVFRRQVLASTVPVSLEGIYQGGDHGILQARDVETGALTWEFDTIASDDIWGEPEINSGGGSWYPPSIDVDSGVIFWGVANPAPFPGTPAFPNGTSRPGPNLYTNSVVALNAEGGQMEWYRQATPHDIFDRDLVHTLLVDVEIGGRHFRVVVGTGKAGLVIGHDLETGELLWETPIGHHENDELDALDGPTEVWPGTFGGVLTPPAAADGVVYVATLNAPTTLAPDQTSYIGSQLGTAPGQILAIDAADGRILWDVEVDGDPLGATTVVNDLVFTATFQGRIYALDRTTGETVHTIEAPGGINGWPAIAGDDLLWPVGVANPPRLVAYRLNASSEREQR